MKRTLYKSTLAALLLAIPCNTMHANESQEADNKEQEVPIAKELKKKITPFTGQVEKNRVRMRVHSSLDSPVVKELNQGDMVVVVTEDDEFYGVLPPEEVRAYIFRTYVLDGVVEGHHVNVRLEPALDSPVVAQLNTGDSVTGRVSPINNKWLEIVPPKETHFYVSKDYITNVGDSSYMARVNKRRSEVNQQLDSAYIASHQNFHRPFEEIDYDEITAKYESLIKNYPEFEQQASRAKELLVEFKDQYTKKKIAYLEAKSKEFVDVESLKKENSRLAKAYQQQKNKLNELEGRVAGSPEVSTSHTKNSPWTSVEETVYIQWTQENGDLPISEFYAEEQKEGTSLKGTLQPYDRNVKNKPGDYVLLNSFNTPIAFLYSTKVNLQDYVGEEVTMIGAPRPNNRFAYPAYHVMSIQ